MTSYIAVHEENGIYLGIASGYALFSNAGPPMTSKAIRFSSPDEIHHFFQEFLPKLAEGVEVIEVQTKEIGNYVSVVDILKSGYNKHTANMVENLPMISESIH